MNIDIDKLINDGGFIDREVSIIKSYEVKPVNCGGCQYFDEEPMKHCLSCAQNDDFIDNYKPKQNELDNLFKEFDALVEKIECYREK